MCNRDTFEGRCATGSVLEMTAARYGRVKVGDCISSNLGFLGCGKDALPEMDAWCSGRQSCSVKVDKEDNVELNEGNTCVKDVESHLEVQYRCSAGKVHMAEEIYKIEYLCAVLLTNIKIALKCYALVVSWPRKKQTVPYFQQFPKL